MRFGLGTIIQAEDALDYILEIRRKLNRSGASAVVATWMFVLFQLDAKRLVHCSHCPGENDCPARRALFFYREIVFAGKRLDTGDATGIRPMQLLEFLAVQNFAFLNRFLEFVGVNNRLFSGAGSQTNCHVYYFGGVGWGYLSRSFFWGGLPSRGVRTFFWG